jgi:voltage-gated potassium channel
MDGPSLLQRLRRRRYLALLISLLLLVVLHPVTRGRYVGQETSNLFLGMVFLTAIFAVSQRRRPFLWALALGVPALAISWIAYLIAYLWPDSVKIVILARDFNELLFLGFAIGVVLCDVLEGEEVTGDRLCGAMCAYLMIGVTFATIYATIDLLQPGSFTWRSPISGHADPFELRGEVFSRLLYYSFVTLTTLGYGDIRPVSTAARTFSWLEAVCGQLYLAILIARLVGLHIVHTKQTS